MIKIKSLFWLNGLFLFLFGLFLFFSPESAFRIVIVVLSIEVMISGIFGIMFAWQEKGYHYRGLLFFGSLLQFMCGLALLVFPSLGEFLVSLLVVLLGLSILVKGGITLFEGLKAKDMKISTWWLQLFMGALAMLFGGFLITNAFLSFLLLNVLLGLSMVISGFFIIIAGFQLKGWEKVELEDFDD